MTKAEKAVDHMMKRLLRDDRLANFICPATEAFALLTDAYAEIKGLEVEMFRKDFAEKMTFEKWPKEAVCPECQAEFSL